MLTPPAEQSWNFHDVQPSPSPGVHIFAVQFHPNGAVEVEPVSDSPAALAQRMEWLMALLTDLPELLRECCGEQGAARALFGRYTRDEGAE